MTFTTAKPVPIAAKGTGISARTTVRKGGAVNFILSITGQFQEDNFGGLIGGKPVKLEIGRGTDAGLLKITIVEEETEITVIGGLKYFVRIRCAGWGALGTEPHKSESCKVVDFGEGSVTIRLPDWANGKEKFGDISAVKSAA